MDNIIFSPKKKRRGKPKMTWEEIIKKTLDSIIYLKL